MGGLFSFDGRIGRQTWWLMTIGISVVAVVLALSIASVFLSTDGTGDDAAGTTLYILIYVIAWVASLATSVKRWHDRGKSGWWVLIGLVPFIGGIWALIENGFLAGTPGPNQYGPQP